MFLKDGHCRAEKVKQIQEELISGSKQVLECLVENERSWQTSFSLFLSTSTHRNNCGFYFYLLEILKELCLCLRCWPHPKYVYMHSTQCNTNTTFLEHFNGPIAVANSCWESLSRCSPQQHCPRSTFGHSSQIPEHSTSRGFQ